MRTAALLVFVAAILSVGAMGSKVDEVSPATCNAALRANLANPETVALCSLCKDVMRLAFRFAYNRHTRSMLPSLMETHACAFETDNRRADCQHLTRSVVTSHSQELMETSFLELGSAATPEEINRDLTRRGMEMCVSMSCCDEAISADKKKADAKALLSPTAAAAAAAAKSAQPVTPIPPPPPKKSLVETDQETREQHESELETESSDHAMVEASDDPAKKPEAKKVDDKKADDKKTDAKKTDAKPAAKPEAKKTDAKPAAKPEAKKADAKPAAKPAAAKPAAAKPAAAKKAEPAAPKPEPKGKNVPGVDPAAAPSVIISPLPDKDKMVAALESEKAKLSVHEIKLNMRKEDLEESKKKIIEERNQVESIRQKLRLHFLQAAQAKKNLLEERKSLQLDKEATQKKSKALKNLESRLRAQESAQAKFQFDLQTQQEKSKALQAQLEEEKKKLEALVASAKAAEAATLKAKADADAAKKAAEDAKKAAATKKVSFIQQTDRLEAVQAALNAQARARDARLNPKPAVNM